MEDEQLYKIGKLIRELKSGAEISHLYRVANSSSLEGLLNACRTYWAGGGKSRLCYGYLTGGYCYYFQKGWDENVMSFQCDDAPSGNAIYDGTSWTITYTQDKLPSGQLNMLATEYTQSVNMWSFRRVAKYCTSVGASLIVNGDGDAVLTGGSSGGTVYCQEGFPAGSVRISYSVRSNYGSPDAGTITYGGNTLSLSAGSHTYNITASASSLSFNMNASVGISVTDFMVVPSGYGLPSSYVAYSKGALVHQTDVQSTLLWSGNALFYSETSIYLNESYSNYRYFDFVVQDMYQRKVIRINLTSYAEHYSTFALSMVEHSFNDIDTYLAVLYVDKLKLADPTTITFMKGEEIIFASNGITIASKNGNFIKVLFIYGVKNI